MCRSVAARDACVKPDPRSGHPSPLGNSERSSHEVTLDEAAGGRRSRLVRHGYHDRWRHEQSTQPGVHNGVITACVEPLTKGNRATSGDLNFLACLKGALKISWNIQGRGTGAVRRVPKGQQVRQVPKAHLRRRRSGGRRARRPARPTRPARPAGSSPRHWSTVLPLSICRTAAQLRRSVRVLHRARVAGR